MRWTKALGRPVIDRTTGETVGKVDGLIPDVGARRIIGLVVDDRFVRWSDSGGIGHDAVTIPGTDTLSEPSDDQEKRAIDVEADPLRRDVYTEDGFALGSLTDIDFDAESGEIGTLIISDGDLAGSRLLGIGSYAVVVSSPDRAGGEADATHRAGG